MSSGAITTESGSSMRIAASEGNATAAPVISGNGKEKGTNRNGSNNVAVAWIVSLVSSVLSLNGSNPNNSNPSGKSKASTYPSKGIFSSKNKGGASISVSTSPPASAVSPPTPVLSSTPTPSPPTPSISSSTTDSKDSSPAHSSSSSSSLNPSIPSTISLPAKRKTLILDLDETLVHSTIKPVSLYHMTVEVTLEGVQCTFFVIKRPHVDAFLKQVAEWYDVTIFTASMRQYADPLLDQLDVKKNLFQHRLFRESCLYKEGSFIKDLGLIGQDLANTIIIDNSPVAYSHNRDNALPIDNWLGDNPKDESLLNLLPFLDALRFTQDVRSILSLRVQS